MAKVKEREGRGEVYWRGVVRQQVASGLTVREFCRRGGLRESTFYFWRRELPRREAVHLSGVALAKPEVQRGDAAGRLATAAFVPVSVTGGDGHAEARQDTVEVPGRIEIALSGGQLIRVTAPVDRQALADVVAVREGRPC